MSNIGCFFSEFFATAVLLCIILALGDANNNPVPAGMNGHTLLWLIVGIGAALGTQTAYCLNPARDWGPRIAASMYGVSTRPAIIRLPGITCLLSPRSFLSSRPFSPALYCSTLSESSDLSRHTHASLICASLAKFGHIVTDIGSIPPVSHLFAAVSSVASFTTS